MGNCYLYFFLKMRYNFFMLVAVTASRQLPKISYLISSAGNFAISIKEDL